MKNAMKIDVVRRGRPDLRFTQIEQYTRTEPMIGMDTFSRRPDLTLSSFFFSFQILATKGIAK